MPPVMGVVGLYMGVTVPLLFLLVRVHRLRSDYTRWFVVALILQIIPIGLAFFPLGFVGVAILAASLAATWRRNARFRAMGLESPDVARRWRLVGLLHLWALGFSLEQKAVSYLFLAVINRQGLGFLWSGLLPFSAVLWLILAPLIIREWRSPPA